ncbi:MAG: 4-alpha-glucanotransferase [Anaerolineaceae bacterium]|nr:4-alpha-glucanotransferase [Anaerolineaceae bacterium]
MNYERSAGILLHPTCLPGPDGIGDFGPEAYHWINFLAEAGCSMWQVLPLGPTGYGNSPYQSFSAFAGNTHLVSPALLLNESLLTADDLINRPVLHEGIVHFEEAIPWKLNLLDKAFECFQVQNFSALHVDFEHFKSSQNTWLDDYALFMTLKEVHKQVSWNHWPEALRNRKKKALENFSNRNQTTIAKHCFRQFLFYRQWNALHKYAAEKNIRIIGDIPIFVSYDSADVWAHPELFALDATGQPAVVAGVPPDYFSPTGQLWGNPLYRWEAHKKTGYSWWIKRFQSSFQLVDILRLDHFRGFAGYWEVPAGMPTAEKGRWVSGPGNDFFIHVQEALKEMPIIAEDLGDITPEVIALRDAFNLPGMKILQFAFSNTPENPFLPHHYPHHCVAYTGTHDNDTSIGWYEKAPANECDFCRRYLSSPGSQIAWDMIRVVWSSPADMVLAPLQDFLNLGSESRMNLPGTADGNWNWRMPVDALTPRLAERIRELNYLFSRLIPEN